MLTYSFVTKAQTAKNAIRSRAMNRWDEKKVRKHGWQPDSNLSEGGSERDL